MWSVWKMTYLAVHSMHFYHMCVCVCMMHLERLMSQSKSSLMMSIGDTVSCPTNSLFRNANCARDVAAITCQSLATNGGKVFPCGVFPLFGCHSMMMSPSCEHYRVAFLYIIGLFCES